MELTERQLAVLNHTAIDGQAWADNALKDSHILEKVAKWEADYDAAIAKGNYRNRKQRDADEAQAELDYQNNRPYDVKRYKAYCKLNQFEMQFDDQRDSTTTWVDAINEIKAKYPKP